MTRRDAGIVAGAAVVAWVIAAFVDLYPHPRISDIPVYERAADAIAGGAVPYRDVPLEYPPLAAGLFLVARVLPGPFAVGFSLLMLAALLATVAGVAATTRVLGGSRRRTLGATAVVAMLPLVLGDFVQTRFDLALAALLSWTVWAAVARRFTVMWVLLAAAIALKLVPLALVPLLGIWHLNHRDASEVGGHVGGCLAAAAATFLPFVALSPAGTWDMFAYHLDRPLQIESIAASVMLVAHSVAGSITRVQSSFGSQNLVGELPDALAIVGTVAVIVGVVMILVAVRRHLRTVSAPDGAASLVAGVAATIAVVIAGGKVLSPQFLVWLVPLVLVVPGLRGRRATFASVGVLVATQLYFPVRYWDLVALEPLPIWLLVVRNAGLLCLVWLLWPRRPASRAVPATAG